MIGALVGFAARTALKTAVRTAAGAAVGAGVSFAGRKVRERLFGKEEETPDPSASRGGKQSGRGKGWARGDGGDGEAGGMAGGAARARAPASARADGSGLGREADAVSGESTHFGYRTVDREAKAGLVGGVFDSVAPSYDVMNDLMSLGIHRVWKRFTVEQTGARPGQRVLDIAGGTGDLAAKLARRVGPGGHVLLADINASMLRTGRERLVDAGVVGNVDYAQSDAEVLPFADDTFDCVTIAFGLRNVTDKARALASMHRVLKPGGRLLVLEFSKPVLPLLSRAYDAYSFTALPLLGKLVADDAESYRYLAESIRVHPDQETLSGMLREAGLERVEYHNLSGGIVALHKGFKL